MLRLLGLIVLFLFSKSLIAQEVKMIGPSGGHALQISVHPLYSHIIYTSNYVGGLFYSNNSGKTLFPLETYTGASFVNSFSMSNLDTNKICITVFNLSMKSDNMGKAWELIYEHINGTKNAIEFNPFNSDVLIMTRDEKELWRSNDFGESWYLLESFKGNLTDVKIAHSDTSVIYCAAEYGIYRSIDAGLNWEKTLDTVFYDVSKQITINPTNKNSIYFLIGNQLHKSVDGGKTILRLFDDGLNNYVIDPNDTLTIYLLADTYKYFDGNLLRTLNGGLTWERILDKVQNRYFNLNCLEVNPNNSDVLYAGVGGLGVFKSEDKGDNWCSTNLCSSRPTFIYTSNYADANIIFTNVGSWGLLKSNDRGKNWSQPNFEVVSELIEAYNVTFSGNENQLGFLSGSYLQKSVDGGNTWSNTNQFEFVSVVEIHPQNPEVVLLGYDTDGYDVWGDAIISRSVDGGETWQEVFNLGDNTSISGFVFHPSNQNIVYAYSSKKILKSTDIGLSWSVIITGINNTFNSISGLAINNSNPNILYCSNNQIDSDGGYLSKSTNGGENWSRIDSVLVEQLYYPRVSCIAYSNNSKSRLYVGVPTSGTPYTKDYTNGGLYITEDDGKSWYKIFDGGVNIITVDSSEPQNIYFGTKFGIMTFVDTFNVTSVKDIRIKQLSNKYTLYQNFPNPFNPSTTIKYQIPDNASTFWQAQYNVSSASGRNDNVNVELTVYDVLGREVTQLVNQKQAPGNYEVTFNATNYKSGVYFYQLQIGDYSQIKKMVLLK